MALSRNDDEIDQLARVLNVMLDRLDRQVQQIRPFTADAAHELRTPLAALRDNTEIALGPGITSERRKEALEESIEEYDRMTRLTEYLLLLARAGYNCRASICDSIKALYLLGTTCERTYKT